MKKYVFLALIVFSFSGCINHAKDVVEQVAPYTFTKVYTIPADEMKGRWEYLDFANVFYFEKQISEPALTNEVFDYGIMQAFLYYTKDGKDTLCPLPFSDFCMDDSGNQWEEQFTVEFQPGRIKFIQKISDYSDLPPAAESYNVLVRFLW